MVIKIFSAFVLIGICISGQACSNKNDANYYLNSAKAAYESGSFSEAKLKIDSIKILYPKAFNEITEGFSLMQEIRYAENQRNIAYCDSMLPLNYSLLKEMLTKFDYERDKQYQEFGNYIPKSHSQSKSISGGNTLRSGVGEKGTLYIESVVKEPNVNHHKIKVTLPTGEFAESNSVTSDGLNYRFSTLDVSYEIVRYTGKDENGVSEFIHTFNNNTITVNFIGKRNITHQLTKTEKSAISQSYELSRLLTDIERLKFEKERSEALLRYLQSKKQ